MKLSPLLSCGVLVALATPALAQDPEPGSVLVYPSIRETGARSVVSLTNTHPTASVVVRYSYVAVVPSVPFDPFAPSDCLKQDVFRLLTPFDTITLSVTCDNPLAPLDGYLVVDARDAAGANSIAFDYLIGSQFVVQGSSATYSLPAISFQSPLQEGSLTDLDGDMELDFDGLEYTTCPETLYIDTFLASIGNRLALINLTGGTPFFATIAMTILNDNEVPVTIQHKFRCWFDRPLDSISAAFSFVALLGTPHDPSEFDVDCDGVGDLETGWAIIRGISADSPDQSIPAPALLGAVTGTTAGFERGRPLWRTGDNDRGDFLGMTTVHPEFP